MTSTVVLLVLVTAVTAAGAAAFVARTRARQRLVDLAAALGEPAPRGVRLEELLSHVERAAVHIRRHDADVARQQRRVALALGAMSQGAVLCDEHGEIVSSRMSAKRCTELELFDRLVSWPTLVAHPNLTIEVLLCDEDHVRGPEAGRSRSGRRTRDPGVRQLNDIIERVEVAGPRDALALLPEGTFAEPLTTRELAKQLKIGRVLATRIVYCLRAMDLVQSAGNRGRSPLYSLVD